MSLWMVSVACLVLTAVCCMAGALAHRYNENLGQQAGMALLCFGASTIAWRIWRVEYVNPDAVLTHAGLALFAVSTAWKVYRHPMHYAEPEPERQRREARMFPEQKV
jgi:hypothetical protein